MNTKEFNLSLAKSIKDGIAKHQTAITQNKEKELNGLGKLQKTVGGQDPALTGAGGDLGGSGAMAEVPNLARAESPVYKRKKGPGEGWTSVRNNPANKDPFAFSSYQSTADVDRAKKNNTRAEHEASKVEKGEMDGNEDQPSCSMCGGPAMLLGVLGNLAHMACRNCGSHTSTPIEENTEAKEGADPTVAKGEKRGEDMNHTEAFSKDKDFYHDEEDGDHYVFGTETGHAYSQHSTAEKAKTAAKALRDRKLTKGELTKLPDGSGFATGTVKKAEDGVQREIAASKGNKLPTPDTASKTRDGVQSQIKAKLGKEEISPAKEVPMTQLVTAEKVKGAKDGSEKVPAAKDTDGSGDVSKGKPIAKGAMVDHIKASAAKAGVPVKSVLGYKPPKTLQSVTPTPSPNFNKASIQPFGERGGVGREIGLKHMDTSLQSPTSPNRIKSGMIPRLTGGVQSQIAAKKQPLIPMVNQGVVAKGEYKGAPGRATHLGVSFERGTLPNSSVRGNAEIVGGYNTGLPHKRRQADATQNNKRAEHEASKVEKAESPATKPVSKSPSSGPAAHASAPKPAATLAPKVSKL
jgi:hypothetical protein